MAKRIYQVNAYTAQNQGIDYVKIGGSNRNPARRNAIARYK